MSVRIILSTIAAILVSQSCATSSIVKEPIIAYDKTSREHRYIVSYAKLDYINAYSEDTIELRHSESKYPGAVNSGAFIFAKAYMPTFVADENIQILDEAGKPHLVLPKGRKLSGFIGREEEETLKAKNTDNPLYSYYCGALDKSYPERASSDAIDQFVTGCFRDQNFDGILDTYLYAGRHSSVINLIKTQVINSDEIDRDPVKKAAHMAEFEKQNREQRHLDIVRPPLEGPYLTEAKFTPFKIKKVPLENRQYYQQSIHIVRFDDDAEAGTRLFSGNIKLGVADGIKVSLYNNPSPMIRGYKTPNYSTTGMHSKRNDMGIFSIKHRNFFKNGEITKKIEFLGNTITITRSKDADIDGSDDVWKASIDVGETSYDTDLYLKFPKMGKGYFQMIETES